MEKKEAMKILKDFYDKSALFSIRTALDIVIPELKESEGERIRNWLMDTIKQVPNDSIEWETIDKSSVLAWLEKHDQVKDSAISQHENKTCKENGNSLTSEDERIREVLIELVKCNERCGYFMINNITTSSMLAWLEKQGEPIDKEKVLIGARKDIALSIINFLDINTSGMCLSNMECEDLEAAVVNSKWLKLYNYMKKKLEKQGQKEATWNKEDLQ